MTTPTPFSSRSTETFVTRKPVKYLTNKELLAEIARCKKTYCEFLEPRYSDYDAIVADLDLVDDEFITTTCARRSKELTQKGEPVVVVEPHGLIIRLITYDHIPLDPDRKRKSRAANQTHAVTTFTPFKHFELQIGEDGGKSFIEVGRSHWEGGFENGHFSPQRGRMTERMGRMLKMLVERYARRGNFRGYTYNDEMSSLALMQLAQVGLQFDEHKSANPFAFYTQTIKNCFIRIINTEKKSQMLRDDLLIAMGAAPSYTRQIENELAQNGNIEPTPLPAKRGRKTAAQVAAEKAAAKPIHE